MNTKGLGQAFLCLLFIGALAGCGRKDQKDSTAQVKDYPVMTITLQSTTLYTDYPATIEGQQNVEIRPMIEGYIEKIYVDEGATVTRGQQLFKIRAPQFEQEERTAQANIKIAQANVNAAEMQVNKVRPLVQKNIISKYELEAAEFELEAKRAALAQAEATLVNARTNVGYTMVTSPVNGVIGTLPLKIGSLVSPSTGTPLTTVSNIGQVYAYFSINEKQALHFATSVKGATSEERLKSLPPVTLVMADGTEFSEKGRVETASGLINTATGSVQVRATFPNPNNVIRSGSSGMVRIPANLEDAILVPQKSTYEIQGKTFVYVLGDSSMVRSAEIKTRNNSGGRFFVVTEGLQAGDKIVVEGVAGLREHLRINPKEVNADSLLKHQVD